MTRILVSNRGEIAVRIVRAISELGETPIAVYAADDRGATHARMADEAIELPGTGPAAYLDVDSLTAIAADCGAQMLHPGYGFLSESSDFARSLRARGIDFIGPSTGVLETFGNKTAARLLAEQAGIPVPAGSAGAVTLAEAEEFFAAHGPVMVKAVAGGGGRGMREVRHSAELRDAYERCTSEAAAAFGDGSVFVEQLIDTPRHIEVQIVADRHGGITHLWERDCSMQRRHQKIVEVAPSPDLADSIRSKIVGAAIELARIAGYENVGTVEFLVSGDDFYFMEANPRLQVEHTVTEEITGVDLVATQLRIARGERLADFGLRSVPPRRGFAVQARINAETLDATGEPHPGIGTLKKFELPSGPGIRVDTAGCPGWTVSPRYDPLLAKVVARGESFTAACTRAATAVAEFIIDPVPTNRPLLQAILTHPGFVGGSWDTTFVREHLPELSAHRLGSAGGGHDPKETGQAVIVGESAVAGRLSDVLTEGTAAILAPMSGVVATITVGTGDLLAAGDVVAVLEAMKMEHAIRADSDVRVATLLVSPGDLVTAGDPVAVVEPATPGERIVTADSRDQAPQGPGWSDEVAEIERRLGFAAAMGGPDKVERHRRSGRLTARERIDRIADAGTFGEIGALAGFAHVDDAGQTRSVTPTNFLAGTARIDGRKVVLGVDDFTLRAGAGDAAIHEKQIFLECYAREMRLPMVRLLDGQSGGGSVTMALNAGYTYVPINPGWDAVVECLSTAPVAAACLGPTVGLGAARLVMSHLSVMVEGIAQLFTAGPPVVRGATGEDLTKEQLGGVQVHRRNGSVERIVATEAEAFDVIRRFLSYLPTSVFEAPPVLASTDSVTRREEQLLHAIPRNPRHPYDIDPILSAVFDAGSVFRYAEYGGGTLTALARLDGHPVGVIAADPFQGATMSAEGAFAITRLVDLCETFHLPLVSLTDQAGMTIGLEAEQRATIRHGARAIAAVYQARVPQAEVIVRRVYGVGGAGIVNRHRAQRSWAWPSGDWGSLPMRGGVEAAFQAQLGAADDPAAEISRLRGELAMLSSPFRTAEKFGVVDLIDPRDTRARLCDWVHDAYRIVPTLLGRPSFGTRP
ncbi:carboxyl transferase domain-containing protein [Gordonia sp. VNK1]|uniref:carboxyl transferase domain-containing protein n=1 Tax=Gordonia oleivorans TaxID=3156618 RepID=UPI0032B5BEDD